MQPKPLRSLSIVFPAYNDAGTIASMVVTGMATARALTDDYEVIVVNDGSRDHTGDVLAELASLYPTGLRVITHTQNRGYGGALRHGFDNATKEWVFYTDGDAQYDVRELSNLVAMLGPDIDMVNGYKITRNDPFHRVIVGEIYRVGVKILFGLKIRDVDCDFRLMHRSIFNTVELTSSSGTITLEMVRKIQDRGFRIAEAPVHHFFRAYGTSQFFNFRRVGRTLADLAVWWWRLVGRQAFVERGKAIAPASVPDRSWPGDRPVGIAAGPEAPREPAPVAVTPAVATTSATATADAYRSAYKERKVLITGGLGFIGSNLARHLVDIGGVEIAIVDSMVPGLGGNPFNLDGITGRVKVHTISMGDRDRMLPLLKGVDVVFNLAGSVSHIDSMNAPLVDLQLNTSDHVALLEACRAACPEARVVYTSTRQVYGRPDYLPVDESHPLRPADLNGVHKHATEQYHAIFHRVHGIKSVVLRLTNTYGPRQLVRHARQGFIGWFVRQAMDGEEITIYGDGRQLRDLTYVDDAVDAILRAGVREEAVGQIMNLGGPTPVSLADIAALIIHTAGSGSMRLVPWPAEKRAIDIGDSYCDYRRAHEVMSWEPRTHLEVGMEQMIDFYRRHRDRYWTAPDPTREKGAMPFAAVHASGVGSPRGSLDAAPPARPARASGPASAV